MAQSKGEILSKRIRAVQARFRSPFYIKPAPVDKEDLDSSWKNAEFRNSTQKRYWLFYTSKNTNLDGPDEPSDKERSIRRNIMKGLQGGPKAKRTEMIKIRKFQKLIYNSLAVRE